MIYTAFFKKPHDKKTDDGTNLFYNFCFPICFQRKSFSKRTKYIDLPQKQHIIDHISFQPEFRKWKLPIIKYVDNVLMNKDW